MSTSFAELAAAAAVELFFLIIAAAVLFKIWSWFSPVPTRQAVQAFQVGVVLRDGCAEKLLDPGMYWITPKRRLVVCDVRPAPFAVGAEVLTSDGAACRIQVGGEVRVANAAAFVTESRDAFQAFALELQTSIRVAVGELASSLLVQTPGGCLAPRLRELVTPRASQLGIEILKLDVLEACPMR